MKKVPLIVISLLLALVITSNCTRTATTSNRIKHVEKRIGTLNLVKVENIPKNSCSLIPYQENEQSLEEKSTQKSLRNEQATITAPYGTLKTTVVTSNGNDFISRWNTTLTSVGSSGINETKLPLIASGTYNFTVFWGDDTNDTITSWDQTEKTHSYVTGGDYTINITGTLDGWQFNNGGDKLKLIEISQWGKLNVGNSSSYFYGCENLVLTASDAPDLNGTTTLFQAFRGCLNLGNTGDMNNWNVSSVTDMGWMFRSASAFNQDLSAWNVSSVTNMRYMFSSASAFNQDLSAWNVSSVTNMDRMFRSASAFNQDLSAWNVSSVTDMNAMFWYASAFNQYLNAWNVSSVTNMRYMFSSASAFNQPLDTWNVSSVTNMNAMFSRASAFNQDISAWNVSSVTNMGEMFGSASAFNQDISAWNVSSVTYMNAMFSSASAFNQSLDTWNVSSVTNMYAMFIGASAFNQDLSAWNVSSVTNMELMFYDVTLSIDNYDQLLLAWSQLSLQTGVDFNGGSSQYSLVSAGARQYIIDTFGWNILDGGLAIDTTAPWLVSPSNIIYEEDTTGNSIVWITGDVNPFVYNVTLNGYIYVSDTVWINGTITVNIDGLNPGTYTFKIIVYDSKGNSATDSVQVIVLVDITGNITTDSVQITPGFELLTIVSSLVFLLIFRQKWKGKCEK